MTNTRFLNLVLLFLTVVFSLPPDQAFAEEEINDPLEGFNRGIFWFNDRLDRYLIEPVARAYDYVVPNPVQDGIGNFFSNLGYPSYLLSDLVQLKFGQALDHTGRFLVNTTFGVGGFIDVAEGMGLPEHDEDFGIALAYNGVPAGPYLVLPLLGPSNLRDGVGRAVDSFIHPVYWIAKGTAGSDDATSITLGFRAVEVTDTRAGLTEAIKAAKESSLDYYLFVQSAYYQYREAKLYDGELPPESEETDPDLSQ